MPDYYNKSSYKRNINYRKRKLKPGIVIGIIILISITVVAGIVSLILSHKSDTLAGTWVYDDYTQYTFEEDGNGYLKVDDVTYDYSYEITSDKLKLDFSQDVVRDCEYSFSMKGNELTLVGGKNTDGGTYKLKKK